jgi:hypothetical protein
VELDRVLRAAYGVWCWELVLHQQRELAAKLQNAQLLKEQNFFVENDLIGMIKVRDRKILWANKAMARMVGKRVSSYSSNPSAAFIPTMKHMSGWGDFPARHSTTIGVFAPRCNCSIAVASFWVDANAAQITDTDSVWIFVDVEAHKKRQKEIEYQATHDALTGLPTAASSSSKCSNSSRLRIETKALLRMFYRSGWL